MTCDVVGDDNCLFRNLSICEYGHKDRHSALRTGITNHMLSEVAANSSSDGSDILKYINSISRNCVWVGEDVILAAADCLQIDILVYFAASDASPQVCYLRVAVPVEPPHRIAFYEPGHFRVVFDNYASFHSLQPVKI